MRLGVISIFLCGTAAAALAQPLADTDTRQSQVRFEQALKDGSTSPLFVAITVVNDGSGARRTGCWNANFLTGALMRERDISFFDARDAALQDRTHVFHFSKLAALKNLPDRAQSDLACTIIATGSAASTQDRTGEIVSVP